MSRFYASIQGARGEATRQGGKASGIRGHIRGWNIGAQVYCFVDEDGQDRVRITLTSGSGYQGLTKDLGTFSVKDLERS